MVLLQVLDLNEMAFTWSLAQKKVQVHEWMCLKMGYTVHSQIATLMGKIVVHHQILAPMECLRYRSRGFVLTGVVWEYLGPQDNAHLVAYQASVLSTMQFRDP